MDVEEKKEESDDEEEEEDEEGKEEGEGAAVATTKGSRTLAFAWRRLPNRGDGLPIAALIACCC